MPEDVDTDFYPANPLEKNPNLDISPELSRAMRKEKIFVLPKTEFPPVEFDDKKIADAFGQQNLESSMDQLGKMYGFLTLPRIVDPHMDDEDARHAMYQRLINDFGFEEIDRSGLIDKSQFKGNNIANVLSGYQILSGYAQQAGQIRQYNSLHDRWRSFNDRFTEYKTGELSPPEKAEFLKDTENALYDLLKKFGVDEQ